MAAGRTLDCYRMETQWVDKLLDPKLRETPGGKKQLLQTYFSIEHRLAVNMNKKLFQCGQCINLHVHALVCSA